MSLGRGRVVRGSRLGGAGLWYIGSMRFGVLGVGGLVWVADSGKGGWLDIGWG